MSRWSQQRKARLQKPPQLDSVEDLTIRVAHEICRTVYSGCDCKQRGLRQVCDVMKNAAQRTFRAIKGEE